MTLESALNVVTRSGTGAQRTFTFPFDVAADDVLEVVTTSSDGVDTARLEGSSSTTFSVSIATYPGPGSIDYPAAGGTLLAADETITIRRVASLLQGADLENQGGYFADVQENALDRLSKVDHQQQEQIDRGVSFTVSADLSAFDNTAPAPVAGKILRIKDDGTGFEFVDDPSASAAAAALSAASAANSVHTVSVKASPYSAAGDGTTDDTAAFVAALAANDDVYVPEGTFLIDTAFSIPSGKSLRGPGTLLVNTTTPIPRVITVGSNCKISDLNIEVNLTYAAHPASYFFFFCAAETTDTTFRNITFTSTNELAANWQGIFCDVRCERINVLQCNQTGGHALCNFLSGRYCKVLNNSATNMARAIRFNGGQRNTVALNNIYNCTVGIAIYSDRTQSYYGETSVPSGPTRNATDNLFIGNVITGNTIDNDASYNCEEGIAFDCYGNTPDSWPEHPDDPVVTFASYTNVDIHHKCVISETGQSAGWCDGYMGVVLTGDAAGQVAIIDDSGDGYVGLHNGAGDFGPSLTAGDKIQITTGFFFNTVSDNVVRHAWTGLIFWGSSWYNTMADNEAIECEFGAISVASVVGTGNIQPSGTANRSAWSGRNTVENNFASLGFADTPVTSNTNSAIYDKASGAAPFDITSNLNFGNIYRGNRVSGALAFKVHNSWGTVVEGTSGPADMEIEIEDTTNVRVGRNWAGSSNAVLTQTGTNTGLIRTDGRLADDDGSTYVDVNSGENTIQNFVEGTEITRVNSSGFGVGGTPSVKHHVLDDSNVQSRVTYNGGVSIEMQAQASTGFMGTVTNNNMNLITNNGSKIILEAGGNFRPAADNSYSLGTSGARWSEVFAGTGTINTSDEREKNDIANLPPELAVAMLKAFAPSSYKWNDVDTPEVVDKESGVVLQPAVKTTNARTHYGFVAQQVEAELSGLGLGSVDFAPLIKDKDTGVYGLRYDQFIPILWAALQDALARIEMLESEMD